VNVFYTGFVGLFCWRFLKFSVLPDLSSCLVSRFYFYSKVYIYFYPCFHDCCQPTCSFLLFENDHNVIEEIRARNRNRARTLQNSTAVHTFANMKSSFYTIYWTRWLILGLVLVVYFKLLILRKVRIWLSITKLFHWSKKARKKITKMASFCHLFWFLLLKLLFFEFSFLS